MEEKHLVKWKYTVPELEFNCIYKFIGGRTFVDCEISNDYVFLYDKEFERRGKKRSLKLSGTVLENYDNTFYNKFSDSLTKEEKKELISEYTVPVSFSISYYSKYDPEEDTSEFREKLINESKSVIQDMLGTLRLVKTYKTQGPFLTEEYFDRYVKFLKRLD